MYGERRKEEQIEETQCSTSERKSLNQNKSCFMAFEEIEVTSNPCDSTSYTFDELQNIFEELAINFESMNLRYKKMISKLNVKNELLSETKIDLEKQMDDMKIEIDDLTKSIVTCKTHFLDFKWDNKSLIKGLKHKDLSLTKMV